jgi:CRISPR-associated protein Cas1
MEWFCKALFKEEMKLLTDLKAILHSKRANIYYLERCRVMQKDGRVLYLSEAKIEKKYWNIPIANTTVILLGNGTSITQAAMRMLASAGVLVGFSGGGGTPLLMANEIEWMTPQSEYRPTEYMQGWMHSGLMIANACKPLKSYNNHACNTCKLSGQKTRISNQKVLVPMTQNLFEHSATAAQK